jgi:hypothetical protein
MAETPTHIAGIPILRDSYAAANTLLLWQTMDHLAEQRVPERDEAALDALLKRSGLTHQDVARIALKRMARDQGLAVQDLQGA